MLPSISVEYEKSSAGTATLKLTLTGCAQRCKSVSMTNDKSNKVVGQTILIVTVGLHTVILHPAGIRAAISPHTSACGFAETKMMIEKSKYKANTFICEKNQKTPKN